MPDRAGSGSDQKEKHSGGCPSELAGYTTWRGFLIARKESNNPNRSDDHRRGAHSEPSARSRRIAHPLDAHRPEVTIDGRDWPNEPATAEGSAAACAV